MVKQQEDRETRWIKVVKPKERERGLNYKGREKDTVCGKERKKWVVTDS